MKLIFLGSGSAFSPIKENFQSNMLLEAPSGKRLLIDCGTDARLSLSKFNLTHKHINAVYISHFHADHAGGLEWLGFSTKFESHPQKPKLFTHPSMIKRLWSRVLSGGLQSLKGKTPATFSSFFKIAKLKNKKYFTWTSIRFELVKTIHVYNGKHLLPSFGLFFEIYKTKIFITTDTQFTPQHLMPYYQEADIIFQDCETLKKASKVHAQFKSLTSLPEKIKSKMWLYHYNPGLLPHAKAHGFRGFVKRGQIFHFEKLK